MLRRPPTSTLFPYTTLFRSHLKRFVVRPLGRAAPSSGSEYLPDDRNAAPDASRHQHGHLRASASRWRDQDRKSTRLNSSHANISYAVFCLKKKKKIKEH